MSATAPGRREMLWWHQARHCIVRLRLGASGRSAVGKGEAAPSEDEAAPSGSRLPASRAWLQAQRQERCSMKRSMRPRGRRVVLRASPPSDEEFCCLISRGLPLVITLMNS